MVAPVGSPAIRWLDWPAHSVDFNGAPCGAWQAPLPPPACCSSSCFTPFSLNLMAITLDDAPLTDLPVAECVGDVVAGIRDDLRRQDRIITGLVCDGTE